MPFDEVAELLVTHTLAREDDPNEAAVIEATR